MDCNNLKLSNKWGLVTKYQIILELDRRETTDKDEKANIKFQK